jgi:hypothetical protein
MWYFIILIVVAILTYAMMPRPKSQTPPALGDLNVPTASEGRDVTMIFGTVWIDDPNVINYGDLRTDPIHGDSGK